MVVVGIDPGSRRLGWGVVARAGTRMVHVAHGVVRVSEEESLAERLVVIERELVRVVRVYGPSHASVEGIFFGKDAQAASKLGHARGVALLVCAREGLGISEYPPARVKRTIAGGGRADKQQVAMMVRTLLGLAETPPADAADALALAMTHLARVPAFGRPAVRAPRAGGA